MDRNNLVDTKVNEKGDGGGIPGTGADIPLRPMLKTMVKWVILLQPMEYHRAADIHLQSLETSLPEQVDMPSKELQPIDSPCRSRHSFLLIFLPYFTPSNKCQAT